MGKDIFHPDVQLFIDHRFDWGRFLRLRGDAVNVADEVETYKTILRTAGEICADIEAAARDHWHEEVRLENGRVVVPPHIAAGYEKLRDAGLLCLTLGPQYGGYGLPALVNCAYLEMVSRADPSLMTIVGLQAGVALDIEKYGTDELRQRYLPRFVKGELQGCMDLTEPQAGSDLGGIVTRVTRSRAMVDGSGDLRSVPPVALRLRDLKQEYNIQTAREAWVEFNLITASRPLALVCWIPSTR